MIWFWIIVAGLAIIVGGFIFTQGGNALGPTLAGFGAVILLILLVGAAHAQHPPEHQALHEKFYSTWMMPDSPRTSCCSNQDCAPAASRVVNEKWQAQEPGGDWVDIPENKIEQHRDSPDGRSHLCGRKMWSGFAVFCFVRGGGT